MRRVPTVGGVTLVVALISGMMLGATMAAEDTERVDVGETMRDDLFTDDGQINTSAGDPPARLAGLEHHAAGVSPDTPRLDSAVRQAMIKPLLVSMIWVSDVGSRIGYTMATTIGVGATKLVLQSAVVAMLAGAVVRIYQTMREVVGDA